MNRSSRYLPVRRIVLWGFVLNTVWEFGQCVLFYDMWDWSFWRGTAWMWAAIFGDVVIVLGVAAVAREIAGVTSMHPLDQRGWVVLLTIGFVTSVVLEWTARALGLWSYSAWMPTITALGHTVGFSPIAQITVFPALSVHLATQSNRRADAA